MKSNRPCRSWLLWRRRGGELKVRAINTSSPYRRSPFRTGAPHHLHTRIWNFPDTKIILCICWTSEPLDCNANNRPLLQQRSLETADLNIAHRWRKKTNTQPRNTRHSLAGSVSELQNSEAFTGDTSSLSLPPLCCFCSCPY